VVGGDLYANRIVFGTIQPNIVIRGHRCDLTEGWWTNASSKFDIATSTTAPVAPIQSENNTYITLTQTSPSYSNQHVAFFAFDNPVDLSYLDFMGFYYRGTSVDEEYSCSAIKIALFSDNEYVRADAYSNLTADECIEAHNLCSANWTESESYTKWKYSEIALLDSCREKRKKVKAVGFVSTAELTKDSPPSIALSKIDFYKLGTTLGPVRGRMVALPIAVNQTLSPGDLVDINSEGAASPSSSSSQQFVGQVVNSNTKGTSGYNYAYGYNHGIESYILVVVDGVINTNIDMSGAYSSGTAVGVASKSGVTKAGAYQYHMGILLTDVPAQGGVYPIRIGRAGVGVQ
jgi:hypothetical protein